MTSSAMQFSGIETAPSRPRRRVLVSAFAASPKRGSEAGVGWQVAARLALHHDVTLLCGPGDIGLDADCFRREITEYIREQGPVPGLTIQFVDPSPISYLFQRESTICRRTVYYIGYTAWQRKVLRVAEELHRRQPFDLVHQLNMTGYREPGFLWKLDAPFVWGPVGGAANFPPDYFQLLSNFDGLFYRMRNFLNGRQMRSARCRAAAERAECMWAISPEDVALVQQQWHRPVERLLETGSTPREKAFVHEYDSFRPLRVVWSGKHVGRKALPILLQAVAKLPRETKVEVIVLGYGPATHHWRGVADSLGLTNVEWTGDLPHAAAMDRVAGADVLALTSVLEGTPHVVVEALSLGVPVICHRSCGMGSAVTPDCGILIDVKDPATSTAAFADAITKLSSEPAEIARLSQGAILRSGELSWDRMVDNLLHGYDRVFAMKASD